MLTVAALYKFTEVAEPAVVVGLLRQELGALGLRGTLLIAPEGINGTLAGESCAIEALLATLQERFGLPRREVKFAEAADWPFKRLKVRLKKEIITFKQPHANPSRRAGTYVNSAEWNQLVAQPDVLLLDTRNTYETSVGKFEGALLPPIAHFTDFAHYVRTELADKKDKKVAMYCTGGIRCEKASAFMLEEGFSEVYHLKGGILQYLHDVPSEQSRWQGECFVFDERGAVS